MLTRITPRLGPWAYCISTHSGQFGAQMPTRSPAFNPARDQAPGQRVGVRVELRGRSSAVPRRHIDERFPGRHGRPRYASGFAPMVSPSSGCGEVP